MPTPEPPPTRRVRECPGCGLDTFFHRDYRTGGWFCPDCQHGAARGRQPMSSPPLGVEFAQAAEWARLYDAGRSLREIGGKARITHATIRDVLTYYDLYKPRPNKGPGPLPECGRGHPMRGENLYIQPVTGKRRCRQCQHDAKRRRKAMVMA